MPYPAAVHRLLLAAAAMLCCAALVGCADGTGTNPVNLTDTSDAASTCGNGRTDLDEACDGAQLAGQSCTTLGFMGGDLACAADCTAFDTTACVGPVDVVCGDDLAQAPEACDGTDLLGQDCVALGFDGGTLACTDTCSGFDTGSCTSTVDPVCGNGTREGDEVCDRTDLAGATCASSGFVGGTLRCRADCTAFDTSLCTRCGNGTVDTGESCDGGVPAGQTCLTLGFDDGELTCDAQTCQLDDGGCTFFGCGDGEQNGNEQCDGADLGGATCQGEGFDTGQLGCRTNCTFDTSGCRACGDNTRQAPEVCDGTDLAGQSCASQGFDAGTLTCRATCDGYDTSGCTACGDGQIEGDETCEGANLAGQTCVSLGFSRGTLACASTCSVDTSGCTTCGNGQVETGEQCEPGNLAGQTCADRGYDSGSLTCTADCTGVDETGCTRAAWPGAGQLVIAEIMVDPTVLADSAGEWFEIYNPSPSTTYSINGCVIESETSMGATITQTILGAPPIPPGSQISLATSAMPGFSPDVTYSGALNLDNAGDTLRLRCDSGSGAVLVDEVVWDGGPAYPAPVGASMTLSPGALSASANDDGHNWCIANTVYNTGGANSDAGTPGAPNDPCPSIYFSEYVEGSSNNKAVEIRNRGTVAYDLGQCVLRRYSNGGVTPQNITLNGTVAANDVYVLCHGGFVTPGLCDETNTLFNVSGNDAFDLVCAGQTFDVFGRIGEDPGAAWTGGGLSTQNQTLRRKCSVTSGDPIGTDAFDPGVEWNGFPQDDFSGLGTDSCP